MGHDFSFTLFLLAPFEFHCTWPHGHKVVLTSSQMPNGVSVTYHHWTAVLDLNNTHTKIRIPRTTSTTVPRTPLAPFPKTHSGNYLYAYFSKLQCNNLKKERNSFLWTKGKNSKFKIQNEILASKQQYLVTKKRKFLTCNKSKMLQFSRDKKMCCFKRATFCIIQQKKWKDGISYFYPWYV